jgi:hypothetical protein
MRMRKGQTAMEYLMTYGWAILIIMVVLAVLFYLGVLNPAGLTPNQCTFPAGVTCVTYKLMANTGQLVLDLGQGTGKTIRVTGVYCTSNSTSSYSPTNVTYSPAGTNVTITSGSHAYVATNSTAPNTVFCRDADGAVLGSDKTAMGSQYIGRVFINYTEVDTGLTRIAVGTLTTKFEA